MPSSQDIFSITLRGASVSRGTRLLFSGLNLSLSNGEFIWVKGDNGMGKSSLLRLCAGLLAQNEGTVEWRKNGQLITAPHIISYQAHRDPLKPSLSAKENLHFWLKMRGFDGQSDEQSDADILAALSAVNMTAYADSRAGTLSAGQSRRVALAKLILDNKPIWLMDEPSAAMDAQGKAVITELIQSQLARGGAVMLASHSAPHALSGQARLLTLNNVAENNVAENNAAEAAQLALQAGPS